MRKSNKQLDLLRVTDHAKQELIEEILEALPIAERDVLCMYYGIGEYPMPYPSAYIAVEFNITRQAVEKKIQAILRKIVDTIKFELKNTINNMQ